MKKSRAVQSIQPEIKHALISPKSLPKQGSDLPAAKWPRGSRANQNQSRNRGSRLTSREPLPEWKKGIFRRRPAPGKPKPLLRLFLRLAAADANSSRNEQVVGNSRAAAAEEEEDEGAQVAPPRAYKLSLSVDEWAGAASRRDRAGWEEGTRWRGARGARACSSGWRARGDERGESIVARLTLSTNTRGALAAPRRAAPAVSCSAAAAADSAGGAAEARGA